jgi:hypothetical protein
MNRILLRLLCTAVVATALCGCVSLLVDGVDPSRPAPNMGYVDFYSSTCGQRWSISKGAEEYGVRDMKGSFIRLERPLGLHTFSVHLIRGKSNSSFPTERAMTVVQVNDGMVSPVDVACPVTGQVPVSYADLVNTSAGPTGMVLTYRTGTRLDSLYTIQLVANPPTAFARKDDMTYARETPFW